jgi:hypothetical protein
MRPNGSNAKISAGMPGMMDHLLGLVATLPQMLPVV